MMPLEIREEPIRNLDRHGDISIAFVVTSVLEVAPVEAVLLEGGRGVPVLRERPAPEPYVKDYDAIPGNHPADWPMYFDVSRWGLLSACGYGRRVGEAVIAFDTPDVDLLEGDARLAVLWDLRVKGLPLDHTGFSADLGGRSTLGAGVLTSVVCGPSNGFHWTDHCEINFKKPLDTYV